MSVAYPLVKRGELGCLETPISAANRVVLIISDTDFDRYRNQVLTCDVELPPARSSRRSGG